MKYALRRGQIRESRSSIACQDEFIVSLPRSYVMLASGHYTPATATYKFRPRSGASGYPWGWVLRSVPSGRVPGRDRLRLRLGERLIWDREIGGAVQRCEVFKFKSWNWRLGQVSDVVILQPLLAKTQPTTPLVVGWTHILNAHMSGGQA